MKNLPKYKIIMFLILSLQSAAQTRLPPGYPDRNPSFDVLPGFLNPPKGWGEVPFYWWQGDSLTHERLLWQMDQLKNKGISSLQINYSHRDSGGLTYGLSNPSKPALYTDDWWNLFKWFAAEAQNRNMTVSLSDYTLGVGQGFSMDDAIKENPDLNGSLLKDYTKILIGKGKLKMPSDLLTLTAFKIKPDSSIIVESRKDLLGQVEENSLVYDFGEEYRKIVAIYSERLVPSFNPMHPESGKAYNRYFFDKFEKALPKGSDALNFFFSDELNFRLNGNLWDSTFAQEFKKRKGYDIIPYLDGLFVNIGSITPKIKLDYNDVIVGLSEENFFKPVYEWHQERGLIFGCDHGGRGRDVAEFGDYFRTQRWNQAPGSDQPKLSKDIIKAKVASSIAHLYNRPRVWLEGFHSSGWGTSSADVTDAIFANFVAGYNLLSFHGLYYSTQGGWWEWAPPDNHFRMPYWKQINPLMNCIQRLSYLLSQGYHSCDVAIIYPTEPVVAEMDGRKSVSVAFETGEQLYKNGIDFDFMDFESLSSCEVKNNELCVAGEKYKVLIVPSMKAIRYASLKKIEEFKNAGGIVVNIGEIPVASEKNGENDLITSDFVRSIFSNSPNMIQCDNPALVVSSVSGKYEAGFKVLTELKDRPYVMHRIIGRRDVYALYNFPAGSKCLFKSGGEAQLWNPWNGEIVSLSGVAVKTGEGTEITLPLTDKEIQIIVFDTVKTAGKNILKENKIIHQTSLGTTWGFELKPSLDNQWGDYQLPAKNELLGAQVRELHWGVKKEYAGGNIPFDKSWKTVKCGYGAQFLKLGALPEMPSDEELAKMNPRSDGDEITLSGKIYRWEEYAFSWKYGVEGDYGHQGYHGLKGEMYDNFIRLGALKDVKMSKERKPESVGNYYILCTSVIASEDGTYDLISGDVKPVDLFVNNLKTDTGNLTVSLKKGANRILMVYDKACETYMIFRDPDVPFPIKQPISMRWDGDYGVLPFDCPSDGNSTGLFAFESAPGLQSFTFSAHGNIILWIDGIRVNPVAETKQPDGLTNYIVNLKEAKVTSALVVFKIDYQPGYRGGAALPQYINQKCVKGAINLGDWSKIDGLKAYSGGALYSQTVYFTADDLKSRMEIDLSNLVSSAELFVNGKSAGIRLSPPWTFDITRLARQGDNQIEILTYNTLANNYTSIPTRYRGDIKSGIIGPVILRFIAQP
jgi:hypothetical protein